MSFDKTYWEANYSEPETMDGIGNAKEHVRYLKSLFELEKIDISSIIDLGFGYGHLFKSMMKAFVPYKACGIEPSEYAYKRALRKKLKPVESTKLKLYNESILDWCKRSDKKESYDLGICTSVLQYLNEKELEEVLPIMSKRIKYLYLTVPTDKELERQVDELEFNDKYAKSRSRDFYHKIISRHFTVVSNRLLESKHHFSEDDSFFTDLFYRF
jgi:hypothetical protein